MAMERLLSMTPAAPWTDLSPRAARGLRSGHGATGVVLNSRSIATQSLSSLRKASGYVTRPRSASSSRPFESSLGTTKRFGPCLLPHEAEVHSYIVKPRCCLIVASRSSHKHHLGVVNARPDPIGNDGCCRSDREPCL